MPDSRGSHSDDSVPSVPGRLTVITFSRTARRRRHPADGIGGVRHRSDGVSEWVSDSVLSCTARGDSVSVVAIAGTDVSGSHFSCFFQHGQCHFPLRADFPASAEDNTVRLRTHVHLLAGLMQCRVSGRDFCLSQYPPSATELTVTKTQI